jgi:hypothetical protein
MQATNTKSFIEVLEDEIRTDLRKEIEAEMTGRNGERAPSAAVHAAGRLETWLASHVGPVTFKTAKKNAYGAPKARAKAPVAAIHAISASSPRVFTATTPAELFALELLNRQSPIALNISFTEDELKSVWRKAALKTHPDRFAAADQITQTRMTVLFRELATAYEILLALTESPATKAA